MPVDKLSYEKRILAISSGGGHWIQLLRMRPAWQNCDVAYATTHSECGQKLLAGSGRRPRFYSFTDASLSSKMRLIRQIFEIARILWREKPDVVVTTGASAGYFAVRFGKLLGCRTIWVDSIANAHELSLSGRKAQPYADLWLTQWEQLALAVEGAGQPPDFRGRVL